MSSKATEIKQIAAQLLAGMLSNPHIYASMSDEAARGQQEKKLTLVAIEMAENLIDIVDSNNNNSNDTDDIPF